jgi:hypothetical protein
MKRFQTLWLNPYVKASCWIVILGVTLSYLAYTSQDSWTDDGIAHYIKARMSFRNPVILIDVWAKPAFNLFYMIPAQFNQDVCRYFTILYALMAALLTALAYKKAFPQSTNWHLIIFWVVLQPAFFSISYDTYTETIASLILACFLYLYYSKRLMAAALVASLLPLARFEGVIILMAIAVSYIIRKRYKEIALFAASIFAWNLAGFIIVGKPFWLYNAIRYWHTVMYVGITPVSGDPLFWLHQQIYVLGPSILCLVLLWFFLIRFSRFDEYRSLSALILVVFVLSQTIITISGKGGSGNHPRFFAFMAPLYGFLAANAYESLVEYSEARFRFFILSLLFVILGIRLLLGWHHPILKDWAASKILVFRVLAAALSILYTRKPINMLRVLLTLLLIIYGFYFNLFRGSRPDVRQPSVRQAYTYWKDSLGKPVPVYAFHPKFLQYAEDDIDVNKIRDIYPVALRDAAKGSIVVWDSWYCPRFTAQVQSSYFDTSSYKLLNSFKDKDIEIRLYRKE